MYDPTPDRPVFKFVTDTTDFSQMLRFLIGLDQNMIEAFVVPPELAWSQN